MPPELVVDSRRWADEHDAEIGIARRRHRAVDDVSRGVVSAHRVNGNPDHVRVQNGLLLGDGLDLAAIVVAAVGAHLVRQLRLVAMRAFADAFRLQRVVRPALGRAGF
jgi:hypothetical protein